MARMRTVKPGFFANADLAGLPPLARLLFVGLWTIADREGRLLDRVPYIRGQVFPYENAPVERLLAALAERGFIVRYAAGTERLIAIPTFRRHQNPHPREAPSVLPPPPGEPAAEPAAQQLAEPLAGQLAEPGVAMSHESWAMGHGPRGQPARDGRAAARVDPPPGGEDQDEARKPRRRLSQRQVDHFVPGAWDRPPSAPGPYVPARQEAR